MSLQPYFPRVPLMTANPFWQYSDISTSLTGPYFAFYRFLSQSFNSGADDIRTACFRKRSLDRPMCPSQSCWQHKFSWGHFDYDLDFAFESHSYNVCSLRDKVWLRRGRTIPTWFYYWSFTAWFTHAAAFETSRVQALVTNGKSRNHPWLPRSTYWVYCHSYLWWHVKLHSSTCDRNDRLVYHVKIIKHDASPMKAFVRLFWSCNTRTRAHVETGPRLNDVLACNLF